MNDPCVFCEIIAGRSPADIVMCGPDTIAFRPLSPVNGGHLLVVPRDHVPSAIENVETTLATMRSATALAAACDSANIITSIGVAATQSIFHLHIHVIPRVMNDGLMVPWGTLHGENPRDPHRCRGMVDLTRELNRERMSTDQKIVHSLLGPGDQ